ncbi:hypothetical protein ACHAXS_005160 [Conticribra weissflogii]
MKHSLLGSWSKVLARCDLINNGKGICFISQFKLRTRESSKVIILVMKICHFLRIV